MAGFLLKFVAFIAFAFASCATGERSKAEIPSSPSPSPKPAHVIIPPVFKYLDGVDSTAAGYGLTKLRETQFAEEDLEVRINVGSRFGSSFFVLKRIAGVWSGSYFPWLLCPVPYGNELGARGLDTPKSGWQATWQRLTNAGILSLSGVHDAGFTDGQDYVVETSVKNTYSLSEYMNPDEIKGDEGRQMTAVGQIIAEEFGLKEFKGDFSCPD